MFLNESVSALSRANYLFRIKQILQIITQHGNAYSYRAITVHLSQSGDWVCNVNVVEIPVLTLIDRTVFLRHVGQDEGKPVFQGLSITWGMTAWPSVQF